MIRSLRRPLARLVAIGIRPDLSKSFARRIRLANAINLFFASTAVIFFMADLLAGYVSLALVNAAILAVFAGLLLCNRLGRFNAGRLGIIVVTTSVFVWGAYTFGPEGRVQVGLFSLIGIPFLLFESREIWQILVGLSIPVLTYFALDMGLIAPATPTLGMPFMVGGRHFQALLSFSIIAAVIHYFRRTNERAEAELEDTVRQLQSAMRQLAEQQQAMIHHSNMTALGEMAGGIAHEINNPLSIISLRVESLELLLAKGTIDREILQSTLFTIHDTIRRITKIIDGLRFVAREGTADPFQLANLAWLIDQVLPLCHERFQQRGVKLVVEPIDPTLEIECQPVLISQALLNLLNNAFDAAVQSEEKWIRIGALREANMVKIEISDSGPGVPPEEHERIFQPFVTTKPVGVGTGLGLSVTKGIVERHGGVVYLDSPRSPTRFVIELPERQLQQP